jgi:hypothetical protein
MSKNAQGPSWKRPNWPVTAQWRTDLGARRQLGRRREGGRRQAEGQGRRKAGKAAPRREQLQQATRDSVRMR